MDSNNSNVPLSPSSLAKRILSLYDLIALYSAARSNFICSSTVMETTKPSRKLEGSEEDGREVNKVGSEKEEMNMVNLDIMQN